MWCRLQTCEDKAQNVRAVANRWVLTHLAAVWNRTPLVLAFGTCSVNSGRMRRLLPWIYWAIYWTFHIIAVFIKLKSKGKFNKQLKYCDQNKTLETQKQLIRVLTKMKQPHNLRTVLIPATAKYAALLQTSVYARMNTVICTYVPFSSRIWYKCFFKALFAAFISQNSVGSFACVGCNLSKCFSWDNCRELQILIIPSVSYNPQGCT
jgi:hypothetical protein